MMKAVLMTLVLFGDAVAQDEGTTSACVCRVTWTSAVDVGHKKNKKHFNASVHAAQPTRKPHHVYTPSFPPIPKLKIPFCVCANRAWFTMQNNRR